MLKLAVASGGIARGVAIVSGFIQVPLAGSVLEMTEMGIWSLLTSTLQLLSLADLGLGLGIQNRISTETANQNHSNARQLMVKGVKLISLISIPSCGIAAIIVGYLLSGRIVSEAVEVNGIKMEQLLFYTLLPFFITLPLSIFARYYIAIQKMWVVNLSQALGGVLALTAAYGAVKAQYTKTAFIVISTSSVWIPNIIAFLFYIFFERWSGSSRCNSEGHIKLNNKQLFREGFQFLIPQLTAAGLSFAPAAIIAKKIDVANVVEFNLCYKLLAVLVTIQSIAIAPLWAIYAHAHARSENEYISKTFKKSWLLSLSFASIASLGMFNFGYQFLKTWSKVHLNEEGRSTIRIFSLYTFFYLIVTPIGVLLNGLGKTKSQAIGGLLTLLGFLLIAPLATERFGTSGTVAALLFTSLTFGWIWIAIDVKTYIK